MSNCRQGCDLSGVCYNAESQRFKEFCPDFGHFRRRFGLFKRRLSVFKRRSKFFKRRLRKFKRRLNFQKPDFRAFERLFGVLKRDFSPKTRDLKNVKFNVNISTEYSKPTSSMEELDNMMEELENLVMIHQEEKLKEKSH